MKRTVWLALLAASWVLAVAPGSAGDAVSLSPARAADAAKPTGWGDQGDGTYRNPALPSDYSDIDCIRVGSDYYASSSTFQYSPGVVILPGFRHEFCYENRKQWTL